MSSSANELLCPACGAGHATDERFCRHCGIPLVVDAPASEPPDPRHERARKVKPQLGEGPLMRVAGARNQAEAEFIQGLLLEEGVPSMLRRSAGFDVPDFLAAGPRDILVPQSGAEVAREVLLQAELIDPARREPGVRPLRLLVGLLAALALGAGLIWVISTLVH